MSRGVFGALKDAVLILDEIKRLGANVGKLVDRVEAVEARLTELEKDRAVGEARDEALIAKFEAATRAAGAETHAAMIERIVRLEHRIDTAETADPKTRRRLKGEADR